MSSIYEDVVNEIKKKNPNFVLFDSFTKEGKDTKEIVHDFIKSVLFEISNMSDLSWQNLSNSSKKWYNDSVVIVQSGKTLDFLPGLPQVESQDTLPVSDTKRSPLKELEDIGLPGLQLWPESGEVLEKKKRGRPRKTPVVVESETVKREKPIKEKQELGTKKGQRSLITSESVKQDIRTYILLNNVVKEDVISFIREKEYKINPLVLHRIFTEGTKYREILTSRGVKNESL